MKSNRSISIDSDILRIVNEIQGFNLSGFVELKLREELETRELLK